jgi:hypothetical protein
VRGITEVLQIGLILSGLSLFAWIFLVALRAPEPGQFLEWARQPYFPMRHVPGGVELDTRDCADCPALLLMGRGFGSRWDQADTLLMLWHLPALALACRIGPALHVCEPNPLIFAGIVALQWLLIAAITRGMLLALLTRARSRRAGAAIAENA